MREIESERKTERDGESVRERLRDWGENESERLM